jgi:DNA polymerase I-like protein with 3'-5' exonuclease and polymerase domains
MFISLDTEYTDLNIRKAKLLSISIGTHTKELLFDPTDLRSIEDIVGSATAVFVQNGAVDWYMLKKSGLNLDRTKFIDIHLMEHLIDERLDHDLGSMAIRYFNDPYKSEFWGKYDKFEDAPEDEADKYERKDVRYTFDLGVLFLEQLKSRMSIVQHVHKLYWTLFDIESEGIRIDVNLVKKTEAEMSKNIQDFLPKLREEFRDYCEIWEMRKWQKEISKRKTDKGRALVDKPIFKFSSDTQVRALLYDPALLGLQTETKTKAGHPSTSYETLEELSKNFPKILPLVEYKGTKAVYATFVKGLLERLEGDRVHPHWSVNGTETGRLSSSNPNFQNMPQDGTVRNFILPDPDCVIIGADFESLEVGVELNLTDDSALKSIMLDGKSKHDITAEAVEMSRKDAKTLNFLCQYGGGVWKIAKTFKVSEKEAKEIYEKYWKAYSGVMDYKGRVFKELADTQQVVNKFGRIRHFTEPKNDYEKARFERQAYSHMVQGPGAEMTNAATVLVADYLKKNNLGRVLMPVHDELVCSVRKDKVDVAKREIVRIMESTNDILGFKYKIKAKPYGPFECWRKA